MPATPIPDFIAQLLSHPDLSPRFAGQSVPDRSRDVGRGEAGLRTRR